jgi:hypothetical protein
VTKETLRGGALRLSGQSSSFLYERLRPGVYLTTSHGRDTGEFGTAPLDLIEREYKLFHHPVQWFFDATGVDNPTLAVSEEWTGWLRANQNALAQLHILTSSEGTHLMISVARHFSNSSRRLMLYCDRAGWMRAISKAIPGTTQTADLAGRLEEPAIAITRSQHAEEGVILSGPGCSWSFRMLEKGVIFSRFKGDDNGDLTDAALDEMETLLAESGQKATWFMDLREAHTVAATVSQTWTEWLTARQDRLGRVRAYAPSPLFPLVLTIAKYRSGTERVLQVHRDLDAFRNDLISATSIEAARSLGV